MYIYYTIRVRYNGRLYTTYVEELEGREVIFRCPTDKYEIIRFRESSVIKVEFISSDSLYTTELLFKKKINKEIDINKHKNVCN